MKNVKIKDFDWDGFKRGEFHIVSALSQNLISVLQALSEKGFVWGMSGTSLTEDEDMKNMLLRDIKREPIYICAGGVKKNGVVRDILLSAICYSHNQWNACENPCDHRNIAEALNTIMIDFEEDKDMNRFKKVKAKDFDSAAFKRKEFRIVMCSPSGVSRTLQFLHDNGYVWGCSKTSLVEDGSMREMTLSDVKRHPVFIIADGDTRNGVLRDMMDSSDIPTIELDFEEDKDMNRFKKVKAGRVQLGGVSA